MPFRRPWLLSLFVLSIDCLIACAVTALAQVPRSVDAQARITTAIDESSLVALRGNVHPLLRASADIGPAPVSMPASRMLLVLSRSTQQEADLQTYLQSVQDENSPNYHKFLSPTEFGERFGARDADLQAVQAWLTGQGFTVNKVASGRMAIEFSGTVGQLQSAFHTAIHGYSSNGERFWANAADPQIPSALAPVVAGIASLNSFKPRAQNIRGPSGRYDAQTHTITPTYTIGNATNGYLMYVGPADAATIYDTPTTLNANHAGTTYDGTGVTIGIAGDSNIDLTQNAKYRATFGLPAKAPTVVVDGADPGENGDAVEAYLDTQVSGGIAPNANVIFYTAADTTYESGLFLAIIRAIDDNQADILNVSFGDCEANFGTAGNQFMSNLWAQAAAQGIAVTVSTGDSGSAGCDRSNETVAVHGLGVNAIGSTPYNIAVGGTDFDALYSSFPGSFTTYVNVTNTLPNHRSALRYIPEEPWNDSTFPNTSILQNVPISVASHYASPDNIIGGGGGISKIYAAPGWQSGFGDPTGRSVPDVSFLAGTALYGALWGICTDFDQDGSGNPVSDCAAGATGNSFNLSGIGGTSASAPAFAGMLALLEQKVGSRLGQADYALYKLAKTKYSTVFKDVVTGDNSVFCLSGTPDCQPVTEVNTNYLSGYNAKAGYDEATGLGSVDASLMTTNWASASFTATTSSLQLNGATTALNITHGQSVAVSAAVAGSGGTPSGNIALVDNLSPASRPNAEGLASFALTSGSVSGTTTSLPGGTYQVSAHYGGDSTFAESNSNAIPVTVSAESSTTTLKVVGYFDPSTGKAATTPYYGFIYLIDAQPYGNSASAASPNGPATGTITFKSGSATLGTAALSSEGVAELQTTMLPGGNDSLTAVFPGDASFQASTSSALIQAVQPALSILTITTDKTNYNVGDTVTLTAAFSSSASSTTLNSLGAAPTGTVTFFNGTNSLGTASVTGTPGTSTGFATASSTFATAKLSGGNNMVTATYSGDGNYAASSTPSYIYVYLTPATTKMTVVPASTTIKVDQPLLLTATMPASGTLPVPTGTVIFSAIEPDFNTAWVSPAIPVANGTAVVTVPANALPLGAILISAGYSGDSDYFGASSTAPLQVISTGSITPVVKPTLPSTPISGALPVTIAVSGPSGDPVPTGSVTISGGFLSWPLVNGSASFTIYPSLPPGPNTIAFSYLGDSNYTPATASGSVTEMGSEYPTFSPANPTIGLSQALSLTVSISSVTNLPPPTGTITLQSGSYTSAATPLVSGTASITIPGNTLPVGLDLVTASYSGDTYYTANSNGEFVNVTTAPPGLALTGTNVSIIPGATTGNTSTITLTPSGGFTGSVTMTASVASGPAGNQFPPTFSFGSTSPVSVTSSGAATATLTITTTAATSAALSHPRFTGDRWYTAGGAALACILLFGIPARRRNWRNMLGLLALLLVLAGGVLSCSGGGGGGGGGGNGNPGTLAGTYSIKVTGTSGATTASGTVTLTVQ